MGAEDAPFDETAGHRHFSAAAFNAAWEVIDDADRTEADIGDMIDAAHASRWHWRQREDLRPINVALSAWQLARAYAIDGDANRARTHAQESLDVCVAGSLGPFLEGYAHEALARAAAVAGRDEERARELGVARRLATMVEEEDDRVLLEADLDDLATH